MKEEGQLGQTKHTTVSKQFSPVCTSSMNEMHARINQNTTRIKPETNSELLKMWKVLRMRMEWKLQSRTHIEFFFLKQHNAGSGSSITQGQANVQKFLWNEKKRYQAFRKATGQQGTYLQPKTLIFGQLLAAKKQSTENKGCWS